MLIMRKEGYEVEKLFSKPRHTLTDVQPEYFCWLKNKEGVTFLWLWL